MKTKSTMNRPGLLALTAALALGFLLPSSAHADPAPASRKKISGPFQVVISRRGNPSDVPLALAGMLNLTVDESGAFTGELTRGKDQFGHDLPGILFRGFNLHPDPTAPSSFPVYGQITGRSISIFFDLGSGQSIIGVGASKSDIRTSGSAAPFGGGLATGPNPGDEGDWGTFLSTEPSGSTTTTCTSVSIFGVELYRSCTTTTTSN